MVCLCLGAYLSVSSIRSEGRDGILEGPSDQERIAGQSLGGACGSRVMGFGA